MAQSEHTDERDSIVDDVGFKWLIAQGLYESDSPKPVAGSVAQYQTGDLVWVKLNKSRGVHGTVETVFPTEYDAQSVKRPRRRLQVDGKGRSRRDVTVKVSSEDDCEVTCGFDRLTSVLGSSVQVPIVVVVEDTESYRQLASCQVLAHDRVVEIGSSTGLCTTILHARATSVVGFDVSVAQLAESRQAFPEVNFQFLDLFEESERLRNMPGVAETSVAFIDINGDREISQVVHAVELLRRHCFLHLRLIAVKSEELHAAALAFGCGPLLDCRSPLRLLRTPSVFLERWRHLRCPQPLRTRAADLEGPCSSADNSALQRKKKRAHCTRERAIAVQAADGSGRPTSTLGALESSLPFCSLSRFGLHCADAGAVCFVIDEDEHPLFRNDGVACVFGTSELASRFLSAGLRAAPAFVGRSGARAALYEFWGHVRIARLLLEGSPLYENDAVVAARQRLVARSRKGSVDDFGIHLLQLCMTKDVKDGFGSGQWPPEPPSEIPNFEFWSLAT